MKSFIHKNALISIGTDGLIGNRVINIEPCRVPAPLVEEGDVLWGGKGTDTEEMLRTLSHTNTDIAAIASELKHSVKRINESQVVWNILEDESLPANIRQSLFHLRSATAKIDKTMQDVSVIVEDIKKGRGSIGMLLRDSTFAFAVTEAIGKIKGIGAEADSLSSQISSVVGSIHQELNDGKGTAHLLLKDEVAAQRIVNTLQNIEQDTKSFNEIMEAIKHSFLFRGYFRKLEKQLSKQAEQKKY